MGEHQVLQGNCPISSPVQEQDVGFECGCSGQTRGVPSLHGVLDGEEVRILLCWKSVGCTPSSTTSMYRGKQSHGMWSNAPYLPNAGGQTKGTFRAQAVVVGAEDVLGQHLMQLDLAIEPFCSLLESFGHRGTHCRGTVETIELSVMCWYLCTCELNFQGGNTGG